MDEHAWACPWCGHLASEEHTPQTATALAEPEDTKDPKGVLKEFKNTEVESEASECADKLKNFCDILSIVLLVIHILAGFILLIVSVFPNYSGVFALYGIIVLITGAILYFILTFIGKLIWSFMKLFVSISAACKRIELSEKKGSQKEA